MKIKVNYKDTDFEFNLDIDYEVSEEEVIDLIKRLDYVDENPYSIHQTHTGDSIYTGDIL